MSIVNHDISLLIFYARSINAASDTTVVIEKVALEAPLIACIYLSLTKQVTYLWSTSRIVSSTGNTVTVIQNKAQFICKTIMLGP